MVEGKHYDNFNKEHLNTYTILSGDFKTFEDIFEDHLIGVICHEDFTREGAMANVVSRPGHLLPVGVTFFENEGAEKGVEKDTSEPIIFKPGQKVEFHHPQSTELLSLRFSKPEDGTSPTIKAEIKPRLSTTSVIVTPRVETAQKLKTLVAIK